VNAARLGRRLARRETHSPRTALAASLAVLIVLACVYLGVEIVLALVGARPLLAAPADMLAEIRRLPELVPAVLVAGGVVVAVLGVALVVAAVRPARRGRRLLRSDRATVVVDDRAIASVLAKRAAAAAAVSPDAVVVSVRRRRADVRLTPTSGLRVDADDVRGALDTELADLGLGRGVRPVLRIDRTGKVGA
jgi:hypothetical protein